MEDTAPIEKFLTLHLGDKLQVNKNQSLRQTQVEAPVSVLVHAVALEHQ